MIKKKYNFNEKDKDFYHKNGFLLIKNFFKKNHLISIKKKIETKKNSEKVYHYFEKINKKKRIRRIERVTEVFDSVKKLLSDKKLKHQLNFIFSKNTRLFKDKLNFKYPGGEGYKPHIDGHFLWNDRKNIKKFGWKEYSNKFISVVIPLENVDKKNGCIYLAKKECTNKLGRNFFEILDKVEPFTPNIKKKYLKYFKFFPVQMRTGDILFFDWKCAHYSKKNLSKKSRMIFYATYCESRKKTINIRKKYYSDKDNSNNPKKNKSLLN